MTESKFQEMLEDLNKCKNVKSVTKVNSFNWTPDGHAISYILDRKIKSAFFKNETNENIKEILSNLESAGATNIKCYYTQEVNWREEQ